MEASFTLQVPESHLDLDLCLFSGQVFRWIKTGPNTYVGIDGGTRYAIKREEEFLTIETKEYDPQALTGESIRATHGDQGGVAEQEFIRLFNLKVDLPQLVGRLIELSPKMEPYLRSLPGLRIMQPSDPVEVFFTFLCTANNHLKRITPMVAKLADYGFQSEAIAGIPEQELRAKGFGYRGATIPHAAKEVRNRGGDEWVQSLKSVGYEEAHRQMVSIKGIGNKLADCICLYGLHYGEAVPIDTHMWQAACRVFFPEHADKPLTDRRYREVGDFFRDKFGDLAGWAHLFLYFDNMRRRSARST